MHLRQQQHRDIRAQPIEHRVGIDRHRFEPPAAERLDPLHHIDVGREIGRLRQDHRPVGAERGGRGHRLEDVHRGRVRRDHLAGLRAEQRRDLVADPLRRADPVGAEPRGDQPLSPFLGHRRRETRCRRLGQRAERIAVDIDQPVAQPELVAKRRQRIARVEIGDFGETILHFASSRRIARTGLASAAAIFSGSAISSYSPGGTSSSTSPSRMRMSPARIS